jgi:hypothetical protein
MIMYHHTRLWRRIFEEQLPASGDWITIGFQDIDPAAREDSWFDVPDLKTFLGSRGAKVTTLDCFDSRADLIHDLNVPVPESLHDRFDVLLDVGTIEHVFDTRQVLTTYLKLIRVGGRLCIHAPVSGYCWHGLHTFHPTVIRNALTGNGCEIRYESFSDIRGTDIASDALQGRDAIVWLVAEKVQPFKGFTVPQQSAWTEIYSE